MSDAPYLVLHTHLTADELRAHMHSQEALFAYVVATLQAREFLLRTLDDYDGTLQAQLDATTEGLWVRQILPRKDHANDRHAHPPQ